MALCVSLSTRSKETKVATEGINERLGKCNCSADGSSFKKS
jgi:hypothetical protein